ncbi:MAG: hypothetical protein ACI4WY_07010 [Anaerovoracaceae bacterium]
MFTKEIISQWIENLNGDKAYRHWARDLNVRLRISTGEESFLVSISDGEVREEDSGAADLIFYGSREEWKKALATPFHCGFYDIFEGACLLHTTAEPLHIASNAKAYTRLWKQLRAALNGEERRWDWNV